MVDREEEKGEETKSGKEEHWLLLLSRQASSYSSSMLQRYTLFVIARDPTGEAEFALYGPVAERIIGASAMQVLRRNTRHEPAIPNVHVAAALLRKTPGEFNCQLSIKCKFIVRVSPGSFYGRWPTFQVISVESFTPITPRLSVMDLHVPS